jgi:CBS domain-containing protein
MLENPLTVHTYTRMPKIVSIFRLHHLRHLPVVTPHGRQLVGIITRKDLFTYMPL